MIFLLSILTTLRFLDLCPFYCVIVPVIVVGSYLLGERPAYDWIFICNLVAYAAFLLKFLDTIYENIDNKK